MAFVDEPIAHLARDVGLGAANETAARDGFDDTIGCTCRLAQQCDLLGVLYGAQRTEHSGSKAERRIGDGRLETQEESRPQPIRYEQAAEPAPCAAESAELDFRAAVALFEARGDELERVLGLLPRRDVDGVRRQS